MFTNLTALGFIVAILVAYYLIKNIGGVSLPDFNLKVGAENGEVSQAVDLGMYDSYNPNAFGTTKEEDRRITNLGVRREYHHDPFPWAEINAPDDCDKHGVPEPTMGQTHVCKAGFPSKRVVDMLGGHFQLNHVCAPSSGKCDEPEQLGRWWGNCGKNCSNPESVGLNIRSICTRCGN